MLGTDVRAELTRRGHDVIGTTRDGGRTAEGRLALVPLDITDTLGCQDRVAAERPDAIIHCAAWTNVDGAEREPNEAYRVNALGAWNVAAAASRIGATVVYVSTDFVFDGTQRSPYTEFDPVNPLGAYGATKEAGERLIRTTLPHAHIIARTSWLFGVHGRNFVTTIQRLASTNPEVPVVADQIGCPTYTVDLARKLTDLIEAPLLPGTYHVCNAGRCSWFEFAQSIVDRCGLPGHVVPITADEFATRFRSPTRRPAYSPMRRLALEMRGMDDLAPWPDALDRFLAELVRGGPAAA
jgi:dTDP-4-dehydrorhamnose reductase